VGVWDAKKQVHRAGNTQKGLPDIFACIRGAFVAIEVKAGKDKQSDFQKIVEQEVNGAKGVYFIVRSTDDFIDRFLKMT
jgi:Holliday junction resolvase